MKLQSIVITITQYFPGRNAGISRIITIAGLAKLIMSYFELLPMFVSHAAGTFVLVGFPEGRISSWSDSWTILNKCLVMKITQFCYENHICLYANHILFYEPHICCYDGRLFVMRIIKCSHNMHCIMHDNVQYADRQFCMRECPSQS